MCVQQGLLFLHKLEVVGLEARLCQRLVRRAQPVRICRAQNGDVGWRAGTRAIRHAA